MTGAPLLDIRFVYFDWGAEPLKERGYRGSAVCRHGHRWTRIDPQMIRVARKAGMSTRPNWYCGPTVPTYCERCGIVRDQEKARALRWRVWTTLANLDSRPGSFLDA